jgi:hippurate hydrolase
VKRIEEAIESILPEVEALRRDLHRHPELGYEEEETARRVLAFMGELPGAEIRTGLAGTGMTVTFGAGLDGPGVALRADMDALAMEEASGVPWASEIPGRMHACGHDGHTAMLAGAARLIAEQAERLEGPVRLIFQPAEEGGAGGKALCEAGVLEDPPMAAAFGLHNNLPGPGLKAGSIACTTGPAMAGTGTFAIEVLGTGGHAAFPHRCTDPVYIGACIVEQLQGLVSRMVDPVAAAVVSVTQFHGGSADNIIPARAVLRGTFRSLDDALLVRIRDAIVKRATEVAGAHGAEVRVDCRLGYPALVNDASAGEAFRRILEAIGREGDLVEVPPNMGGEDFAYFAQRVPAFFYYLPACPPEREEVPMCHSPYFDFNDNLLGAGIRLHVETALRFAAIWRAMGQA